MLSLAVGCARVDHGRASVADGKYECCAPLPPPPMPRPPLWPVSAVIQERVREINARFRRSPLDAHWPADGSLADAGVLVRVCGAWSCVHVVMCVDVGVGMAMCMCVVHDVVALRVCVAQVHCFDGWEVHETPWKANGDLSCSLIYAATGFEGAAIPLIGEGVKGGVLFRPKLTRLKCGKGEDSGRSHVVLDSACTCPCHVPLAAPSPLRVGVDSCGVDRCP